MRHADTADHNHGVVMASREIGMVSMCSCGVVTVTMQFASLRFEQAAFRELQDLLLAAQARIDLIAGNASERLLADSDPVH